MQQTLFSAPFAPDSIWELCSLKVQRLYIQTVKPGWNSAISIPPIHLEFNVCRGFELTIKEKCCTFQIKSLFMHLELNDLNILQNVAT